jgi:uncharacterized protein YmfQ (DUF2313 family)
MTDDTWVQRTAAEYAQAFNSLLPTGPAWPRQPGTILQDVVSGQTQIWGDVVEVLAALLLTQESDPRSTITLLPDWERAFGLPDPCLDEGLTISNRQAALVNKMTLLGAQDRAFFIAEAAAIGYTIAIREFSPFMCGVSRCGDTRLIDGGDGVHYRWEIGDPDMRFYWVVEVSALRFTWFRCGEGQCGIDPMLLIAGATDLECLLRRWKPAHTQVIFDYSLLTLSLDMSLTFDTGYLALPLP